MAGLDSELCQKFLQEHSKYSEIIERLFEKTQYFTTQFIIDAVTQSVNELSSSSQLVYIPLLCDKYGSENWLYDTITKKIIPNHIIMTYDKSNINNLIIPCLDNGFNGTILIVDDWCLSGNWITGIIDDITYYMKNKKMDISCVRFDIITVIATNSAMKSIKKFHNNVFFYNKCIIEPFEETNIDPLFVEFIKQFQPDTECTAFPVHLEYKVANQFGSFPEIYTKCRREITKPY